MSADAAAPLALVTGATGYIGGRLVPELLDAGYRVRAMARHPERLEGRDWRARVEVVARRRDDPQDLARALAGVDVAYYLIHALGTGATFEQRDRATARRFAVAAREAGRAAHRLPRRPAPGGRRPSPRTWSPAREVGEILLASGVPTTVLQAAVIIGSGSASFEMMRYLTERLPAMVAPRWIDNRIQPIAVRDVLRYLVGSAAMPPEVSRTFDIGGPDVLTYRQMMQRYAAVAGLPPRVIRAVPVLTPAPGQPVGRPGDPGPGGHRPPARRLAASTRSCVKEQDIKAYVPDPPEGLRRLRPRRSSWRWPRSASSTCAPAGPRPRRRGRRPTRCRTDPDWAGGSL